MSYYSGAANLDVPLYTIKTGHHELDIHLQYSTNGLKPGEDASWVGLGWSLNAGGVITRAMRGSDDLRPSNITGTGYWQGGTLPPCDNSNNYITPSTGQQAYNDLERFSNMLYGNDDGEPDIFYYNFCGHSGKFVLNKASQSTNGGMALTAERNNLNIAYDISGSGKWTVTDGNGYKYTFSQTETTRSHGFVQENYFTDIDWSHFLYISPASADQNAHSQYPSGDSGSPFSTPVTTSWYLTSIVSPEGELITLTYNTTGLVSSPITTSEEQYKLLNYTYVTPSCGGLNNVYSNIQFSTQEHSVTYLKSITFNGGHVLLNNTLTMADPKESDRDDLVYPNPTSNPKPKKLRNIEVYDDQNILVKRFVLTYGYFNTQANGSTVNSDSRLRLDNLVEYGNDGVMSKKPYQFSYTNSNSFPSKNTYSLDWWGYYNGPSVNNLSLLPAQYFTNPATNTVQYYYGGVRTPTTSLSDLTIGTLNTVVYPTGGTTTFDYELNTYLTPVNGTSTLQTGGGLRVKTITENDGSSTPLVKNYLYITEDFPAGTTSTSSGLLLSTPHLSVPQLLNYYGTYQDLTGIGTVLCVTQGLYYFRTSSSIASPGFSANGAIVGYSRVTEVVGPNAEGGATEYNYKNGVDVLSDMPGTPSLSPSDNGQLTSVVYRDNLGTIKKRVDNTYSQREWYSTKGLKVINTDRGNVSVMNSAFLLKYYDNPSTWYTLDSKTETDFINGPTQVSKTTVYTYNSPIHKEATSEAVIQSDNSAAVPSVRVTKYKRISDYTSNFAPNSVYDAMNKLHMVSPVIEQQTFIQRGTTQKLLSGSITDYKLVPGNSNSLGPTTTIVAPSTAYEFHVSRPLACTTSTCSEFESTISGSVLSKNANYEPVVSYDNYDNQGSLVQYTKANDVPTSLIWGYTQNYLVAQVANAMSNQIAYTSFEDLSLGNWTYSLFGLASSDSKTGKQCYNNGTVSSQNLPTGNYKVSFWAKYTGTSNIPSVRFTNTSTTQIGQVNLAGAQWAYYEFVASNFSGTLNVIPNFKNAAGVTENVAIDELRLYPVGAQMTSHTHVPLVGMSSQTDVNNLSVNYTYDPLGRLSLIQDQDKNILKRYTYQYK